MNKEEIFIDSNLLPQPLSKLELDNLLDKVKDGDEEAIKIIIEHNIRLVLFQVNNRFKSINYDKKDLVSIGILGLINAVKAFDKSKNFEFSSYATKCIDNEILKFLKKLKKDNVVDSLDKIITNFKTDNKFKIEDIIYDDFDITENYEKYFTYKIIRDIIEELPDRDREIIKLSLGFYNDRVYTQMEIGKILSISQGLVSRLYIRNLKRIRNELEELSIIERNNIKKRKM